MLFFVAKWITEYEKESGRFGCEIAVPAWHEFVHDPSTPECPGGASHGIRYQLGQQGVGHGETSCILLPVVCKYNASVNGEKRAILKKVLCHEDAVSDVVKEVGMDEKILDLGDVLRAISNSLGTPKSNAIVSGDFKGIGLPFRGRFMTPRLARTQPKETEKQGRQL